MKKTKLLVSLSLVLSLTFTGGMTPAFAADKEDDNLDLDDILDNFKDLDSDSFFSDIDEDEGKIFVSGTLSDFDILEDDDDTIFDFLKENQSLFDCQDLVDNLKVEKKEEDDLGYTHILLDQCIDNLPIENKSIVLHCNSDGEVVNVTADVENDIDSITKLGNKNVTTSAAVEIAKDQFDYDELAYKPPVEKVAYIKDGQAYETFKVNIKFYKPEITNCDVYVEASSGKVLGKESKIRFDGSVSGTGVALDGTTKKLNMYKENGRYELKDITRSSNGSSSSDDPGEPDNPGNPDDPGNPWDPGNSDDPDSPGNPWDPGNSDDPGNPWDPGNSDHPDDPGNPNDPGNPGKPDHPWNPDDPDAPWLPSDPNDYPKDPDDPPISGDDDPGYPWYRDSSKDTGNTSHDFDSIKTPNNIYYPENTKRKHNTSNKHYGDESDNSIITYSANNREIQPGNIVTNSTNKINNKAAVSAHYYAEVVYDFYKNLFGRKSLDNQGMNLISTVNYGRSYNNAFWDGSQMVYGDGDGETFSAFSGDLDVVGHEMTHGLTSCTADLNYQDQSGALNESMSDVMGVLIQTYEKYNVQKGGTWKFNSSDWVVGDDIYTPNTPGDALRSLKDPTLYDQPDNMRNYDNTSDDNGGVHTNSGIPNKAAYLIAKDIGCEKTARIYYRALTNYMTKTTNFKGARDALMQAAKDLYGSNEASTISNAFKSVGVR